MVQEMLPDAPTAGAVQLHPPGDARETKVVPAGSVSLTVAVSSGEAPLFDAVIVYERLLPAMTGSGEPLLVSESVGTGDDTVVSASALLLFVFGSFVVVVIVAMFARRVPSGRPESTRTFTVKPADPGGNVAMLHVSVPLVPTGGTVP